MPLWSTSDLGEDVISLSYERALRAHARYRPAIALLIAILNAAMDCLHRR